MRGGAAKDSYSTLDHIFDYNVSTLGFQWQTEPLAGPVRAAPVVVDGAMYVHDGSGVVRCIDAATGAERWSYDTGPIHDAMFTQGAAGGHGVAVGSDVVVCAPWRGWLTAIDTASVQTRWQAHELTAIFTTLQLIGQQIVVSGRNKQYHDVLVAFDLVSGQESWQLMAEARLGELLYDPRLDLVYAATAIADVEKAANEMPDDGALAAVSLFAIERETGQIRWRTELPPAETPSAPDQMVMADLDHGAEVRRVILRATRNGSLQVFDQTDGKLIASHTFADEVDEGLGVVALARNVRKGLAYVLAVLAAGENGAQREWVIYAIDPVDGETRWVLSLNPPGPYVGLLSTSGNLIFIGDSEGFLNVYSAERGRLLERRAVGGHLTCPPITFIADGRQMVAIAVEREHAEAHTSHRIIGFALGGGSIPDVDFTREDIERYPSTVMRP